jgi:hypothetical protein
MLPMQPSSTALRGAYSGQVTPGVRENLSNQNILSNGKEGFCCSIFVVLCTSPVIPLYKPSQSSSGIKGIHPGPSSVRRSSDYRADWPRTFMPHSARVQEQFFLPVFGRLWQHVLSCGKKVTFEIHFQFPTISLLSKFRGSNAQGLAKPQ